MATYYLLCVTATDEIVAVRTEDTYKLVLSEQSKRVAELEEVPEVRGTWDGTTYTAPTRGFWLDHSWSGDGSVVGGIREITEGESLTLALAKKELVTNVAQVDAGDNEEFRVKVHSGFCQPSVGKISLVNGVAEFTFTPAAGELGICEIELVPVLHSVMPAERAVFAVIAAA